MTLQEQLEKVHREIKSLNEEIPAQLARQITLFAQGQIILGKIAAAATYDYGKAYADRKRIWGQTIVAAEGTQAVKEGAAEVIAAPYREKEAKAESEMIEAKNLYNAYGEIINAKKLELKVLMDEMGGKNQ